jgi:two-component system, OmpR family, sensor histidine kinase VicK
MKGRGTEKTEVYYNPFRVVSTVIDFVDNASGRIEGCVDQTRPLLLNDIDALRMAFNEARKRGVKIRFVTEINDDNITHCKELIKSSVSELRHLDGVKGNFYVSENEYVSPAAIHEEGKPASNVVYSNVKEVVEQAQYLFETLWSRSLPADQRIKEIEEGVTRFETAKIEIIRDPDEAIKLSRDLIKSAKHEVLRIYPSFNGFRRQIRIGALHLFREVLEHGISVRILVPADKQQIDGTIGGLELALPTLEIRGLDKSLQTQMGIIVVDRKESIIIELKDDEKESYLDAAGLAFYSNSRPIALSYASIFETLWKQGELYEQLKAYAAMQKEFINIAAHELRTPVQPILGLSQVLIAEQKGGKYSELLLVINRNAERLRQLIEDILDVTKIESQSLHLRIQKFNLNHLISSVISEHENMIERQQCHKRIVFDCKDDINIEGDKVRISQVVSNLLSNSIKFTKEEGSIIITSEQKKEGNKNIVVVSVKDAGPGIDSEILPRLFTKFASKSEMGGTGLGLYISKSIIDAHRGEIWYDNNIGKGAIFSFSLPIVSIE